MESRNCPISETSTKMNVLTDRISNLPQSVLHLIFSFLDLKQLVQTSILSKSWRYFWTTVPSLNINSNLIDDSKINCTKALAIQDIVDPVILLHYTCSPPSLQTFRLDCYDFPKHDVIKTSLLFSWIRFVFKHDLQELYLSFSAVGEQFRLPHCVFSSKSLMVFEFRLPSDSPFPLKITFPSTTFLPNLKTLLLYRIQFEGSDDIPNKIFSTCPVLESLTLSHCEFPHRDINIISPNLKHLVMENLDYHGVDEKGYIIKLNAPNLVSFRCEDFMSNDYCVENLSALVKAEIDIKIEQHSYENEVSGIDNEMRKTYTEQMMKFLGALHNVEDLTLSTSLLEVVDCAVLASSAIQFYSLRCLKLEALLSENSFKAIRSLLEISLNIESLLLEVKKGPRTLDWYQYCDELTDPAKLESCWNLEEKVQDMLCSLKFVEVQGIQGCINELLFLGFVLKHAKVLEKMTVFTSKNESPERRLITFEEKLLSLTKASSSMDFLFF